MEKGGKECVRQVCLDFSSYQVNTVEMRWMRGLMK